MLVLGPRPRFMGERALQGGHGTGRPAGRLSAGRRSRRLRTGHVGKPLPAMVALDAETSAKAALSMAFHEAQLRQTGLVVLHAEPVGTSARDMAAGLEFAGSLARWKQDHPDVTVYTAMVSDDLTLSWCAGRGQGSVGSQSTTRPVLQRAGRRHRQVNFPYPEMGDCVTGPYRAEFKRTTTEGPARILPSRLHRSGFGSRAPDFVLTLTGDTVAASDSHCDRGPAAGRCRPPGHSPVVRSRASRCGFG
jgi:hypothetical protein